MPTPTEPDSSSAEVEASRSARRGRLDHTPRFEVTIENLTGGQPLTPPLVATHRGGVRFFRPGRPASVGIQQIAENGNLGPMQEALAANRHVSSVVVAAAGSPPPILPGGSVTFHIEAGEGARFLSFAAMLICTNDGFTGVNGLRLPARVGRTVRRELGAYDAGTEINTEDFENLVPPCPALTGVPSDVPGMGMSDPSLAEGGVVRHHPGIAGIADLLPDLHDWRDPVARIHVKRIR